MRFFSIFHRKKGYHEIDGNQGLTVEEALDRNTINKKRSRDLDSILDIAKDNCEQMIIMRKRLEELLNEYDSVTLYLTDIQKIGTVSYDQRGAIEDSARQIINLNKEREKHQRKERTILEVQCKHLAKYEDIIPKEIRKMEEQEKYQQLVKSDLQQLEGERGTINYVKQSSLEKRVFLKKFSIGISILVFLVFLLLFLLNDLVKVDLSIPFFLAGCMALFAIGYIIFELRNSSIAYQSADLKLNRLITIINKVKIKYVNCTNALDFLYEKYHVNSSRELNYQWMEYVKEKEEAKRYRHNTELLEFYNSSLTSALTEIEVADTEIWLYQPEALLDEKEMVEVRHRLNVRRQKIREQIDSANKQIELCRAEIMGLRKRYPEYEEEIAKLLLPF